MTALGRGRMILIYDLIMYQVDGEQGLVCFGCVFGSDYTRHVHYMSDMLRRSMTMTS